MLSKLNFAFIMHRLLTIQLFIVNPLAVTGCPMPIFERLLMILLPVILLFFLFSADFPLKFAHSSGIKCLCKLLTLSLGIFGRREVSCTL